MILDEVSTYAISARREAQARTTVVQGMLVRMRRSQQGGRGETEGEGMWRDRIYGKVPRTVVEWRASESTSVHTVDDKRWKGRVLTA